MNTPPATPKRKRTGTTFAAEGDTCNGIALSGSPSKLKTDLEQISATGTSKDQLYRPGGASHADGATYPAVSEIQVGQPPCPSPRARVADGLGKLVLRGPRCAVGETDIRLDKLGPISGPGNGFANEDNDTNGDDSMLDDYDLPASHRKRMRMQPDKPAMGADPRPGNIQEDCKPVRRLTPPPEKATSLQSGSSPEQYQTESENGTTEEQTLAPIDYKIDGLPRRNSPKSKINDLTWHDSEITGHLGLDPEDDGTGINGIGFRPTSQQMHTRWVRRKQQLRDWRERESRDERRRRHERRALVGAASAQAEDVLDKVRRVVHFA